MKLNLLGGIGTALTFLRSVEGQFTAGVTTMGTLAWLLWPAPKWSLQPEPTVAFSLSLIAWLFSLSRSVSTQTQPPLSEHDRALLQRLSETLGHNVRMFLRRHDFGASFRWAALEPLHEVATQWLGADYAFDDPELDAELTVLRSKLDVFLRRISDEAYGIGGSDKMSIVPEEERIPDWFSEKTAKRVEAMNEAASSMADDIDVLIKKARRRLG